MDSLALEASFERVEQARGYRAWLMDVLSPWLGTRVLEVGCGVGNITRELLDMAPRAIERVVALDVDPTYVDELRRRLVNPARLRSQVVDVCDPALAQLLEGERLDTAVALNVIEHIDDDVAALGNVASVLAPGGRIIVQVPAHGWLYGSMDRALGHIRRYTRAELLAGLYAAGFDVEAAWEMNAIGVAGWWLNGKVLRKRMFSSFQLSVYEAMLPLIRALEPEGGSPFGLALFAVGRKG